MTDVWMQSSSLAQVPSEGRVAMIDLDRLADPPMVLEGTAAAIWAAIDGRRTVAEVVDLVAEEYALAADDIRTDVEAFLDDLAERGLVRPAEDSARA
jgi:hypothetical protein